MTERRLRDLMLAGGIDSLGLAFGWTVVNLLAVYRHGLAGVGDLNAALLCGVAISAPVTRWLTRRFDGREVLLLTAAAESVLRAATLLLLFWQAPLALVMLTAFASYVFAWSGYAGMRAEIAAVRRDASGISRFVAMIVAVEAVGASFAALIPMSSSGVVATWWVGIVAALYAGSLLPTVIVATGSQVPRAVRAVGNAVRLRRGALLAGAAVMMLGSGPTLLFVGLGARLQGRTSVVGGAIAFAVGSLLSAPLVARVQRTSGSSRATWPLWAVGMVIGWVLAPWSVAGFWLAQLLSGVCFTGFEAAMDHQVAVESAAGEATAELAQASAARALGSATAVRLLPVFVTPAALTGFAAVATGLGVVGCLVVLARRLPAGALRQPDRIVGPERAGGRATVAGAVGLARRLDP